MSSTVSMYLPHSTSVPNRLFDVLLPELGEGELRVLLIVMRQTLGWKQGDGSRKQRDWLSHSQLKTRSGCCSQSVSRAVDSLVRKGLLEVSNEEGKFLLTPAERRRCYGRLYYSLSASLLGQEEMEETQGAKQGGEAGKDRETEVTLKGGKNFLSGRNHPTQTTKQRPDKYINSERAVIHISPGDNSSRLTPKALEKLEREEGLRPEARRFLTGFQDRLWQEGRVVVPPPIVWKRDEPLVIELLMRYSYPQLESLLRRFVTNDSAWLRQYGYSLHTFHTLLLRSRNLRTSCRSPVPEKQGEAGSISDSSIGCTERQNPSFAESALVAAASS